MKKLIGLTLIVCCLPIAESNAQSGRRDGYATQQLFNAPRTKLSSRLKREMERLKNKGVYGEDLRELIARSTLDRTAEGPLVRADRLGDSRRKMEAYEKILRDNIHARNLKYQLKVLNLIRREVWKARVGQDKATDIAKRYVGLRRKICEIEVDGYSNSTPEKRFAKQLRDARKCLAQACKALAQFKEPCPATNQADSKREPPKKPRARVRQRQDETMRRRGKPPQIDQGGGKLSGRQLFYVVGVPSGSPLSLRAAPHDHARKSGEIRGGDKIAIARRTFSEKTTKGWEKVCARPRTCGWVRQRFITNDADLSDSRRVIDYYLISLVSSSLKGMLSITTGEAHSSFSRLHRRHPNGKVKDFATLSPNRWNGKCIVCENGMCQTLYDIQARGRGAEQIVFQSVRGPDGKMRVAKTRNYKGEVRRIFDSLHPYCWK